MSDAGKKRRTEIRSSLLLLSTFRVKWNFSLIIMGITMVLDDMVTVVTWQNFLGQGCDIRV